MKSHTSSVELRKCEQKLSNLLKEIKINENEKGQTHRELDNLKKEKIQLKQSINDLAAHVQVLKDELLSLTSNMHNAYIEMNRIKTGLLYKTRREYEEMIRRFENEMQNSSTYSRAEEARVLGEIRNLKSGIIQLEKYEKIKREHDDTHKTIEHKKAQKEEYWQQMRNLKTKLNQLNEQIKELQANYEKYETKLAELNQSKLELKKDIGDMERELISKQLKFKQLMLEKEQAEAREAKKDEVLQQMEEFIRNLTKLINYFQKLSENHAGSGNYSACQVFSNTSLANQKHRYSSDALSTSSLSEKRLSFSADEVPSVIRFSSNELISESLDESNHFCPSESGASSLHDSKCPTDSNTLSNDQGCFIVKPKNDEFSREQFVNCKSKCKQHRKHKLFKHQKISHSVEVIKLLQKMDIPFELYSKVDQCLHELLLRRQNLQEEHEKYKLSIATDNLKSENSSTLDQTSGQEEMKDLSETKSEENCLLKSDSSMSLPINKINKEDEQMMSTNLLLSDTQSDISSCLDSNYESDYSQSQQKRDSSMETFAEMDLKSTQLKQDNFAKPKSNKLTNSDDSDATVNELQMDELVASASNMTTSSINLNNRIIGLLKQGVISNNDKTITKTNTSPRASLNLSLKIDNNIGIEMQKDESMQTPKVIQLDDQEIEQDAQEDQPLSRSFKRQISDGYCSSNTPLSASSITNEQPNVNPFFKTIISSFNSTTTTMIATSTQSNLHKHMACGSETSNENKEENNVQF